MTTESDTPLREDVKLLGRLLGETLRRHGGEDRFTLVEQARLLSRELRRGGRDLEQLAATLSALPADDALFVTRAFAHFLALANIAEQHHRARRLRGRRFEAEALDATLARLVSARGKQTVQETVAALSIELVLTAHPTEVARRTLLQKYARVAALLDARDRAVAAEVTASEQALGREIEALWMTDDIRRSAPTPEEEARGGWVVIEQSLWQAVPRFLRALDSTLERHTGQRLAADAMPIRFGSWMGGDRDGNPNVTARVTLRVCLLSRWLAADLYLRDVETLRAELSMQTCSAELRAAVGDDAREPYRALLGRVRDRLRKTRSVLEAALQSEIVPPPHEDIYRRNDELLEPLLLCERSLQTTGGAIIASGALLDLIRRVRCFGVGLVRLDLRQEAGRHVTALSEITRALGFGDYATWDEAERRAFLLRELDSARPLLPRNFAPSPDCREVLDTFAVAAALSREQSESLGAYVISMARGPSDVLAVALLQREAGMSTSLRIVPLFETIADLEHAETTLTELFAIPWYRAFCQGQQEVMIGYSDSSKDRGRLTAAFALYEAQERITALCLREGIALTLFHGRGGSVGRGGGSTELATAAQPPGSVAGRLRVTEQGEMIQAKFALPGVAFRTLELYADATLGATLDPPTEPRPEWRQAMQRVSDRAAAAYEKLVKHEPQFIPYFREVTPIEELAALHIGSRPARRKALSGVDGLRAIPWVFAWTQTRLHLPVWLGLPEGFAAVPIETLRSMYGEWPFFRATVDLIAMVLAKSEPAIAAHYERLLVTPERSPLGETLRASLAQAVTQVLSVTGQRDLLDNHPALARAIEVRNPYIDPLNVLQAEFLRRLRGGSAEPAVDDGFRISVNGIANGMRNTG